MKAFRITYTKVIESTIEIEASSPAEAWRKIKVGNLEGNDVIWKREGDLTYKVEKTEEVVMNMASNPS